MRITESVSFWIIIFSLLIACLIGNFTHWIVGLIVFCIIAGKAAIIGIVVDTVNGGLEYHHDRQDLRMKKTLASIRYLTAKNAGVRPVTNIARSKNLIIKR